MAALSAPIRGGRDDQPNLEQMQLEVENAEVVYEGGFQSLRDAGNATAANQGYVGAYTGAAGELFIGEALKPNSPPVPSTYGGAPTDGTVTGDSSGTPIPKALLQMRRAIKKGVAVTGVTSIANRGRFVFATSDNDFTLTPQTRVDPIGIVIRYISTGVADVLFFSAAERYAGCQIQRLWLNPDGLVALTGTSGNKVTGYPMPCKGLILTIGYYVTAAITGSPDTVLNAELDATNITGGTLAIAAASAGAYNVGSSFATAAHFFSRGALLDIEISGSSAATGTATAAMFVDILTIPGS